MAAPKRPLNTIEQLERRKVWDGRCMRPIWLPGDGDGDSDPKTVERTLNQKTGHPTWKLFMHDPFEEFAQNHRGPPRGVYLDDKALYDIYRSEAYEPYELHQYWPYDFSNRGKVRAGRPTRGRTAHDAAFTTQVAIIPGATPEQDYFLAGGPAYPPTSPDVTPQFEQYRTNPVLRSPRTISEGLTSRDAFFLEPPDHVSPAAQRKRSGERRIKHRFSAGDASIRDDINKLIIGGDASSFRSPWGLTKLTVSPKRKAEVVSTTEPAEDLHSPRTKRQYLKDSGHAQDARTLISVPQLETDRGIEAKLRDTIDRQLSELIQAKADATKATETIADLRDKYERLYGEIERFKAERAASDAEQLKMQPADQPEPETEQQIQTTEISHEDHLLAENQQLKDRISALEQAVEAAKTSDALEDVYGSAPAELENSRDLFRELAVALCVDNQRYRERDRATGTSMQRSDIVDRQVARLRDRMSKPDWTGFVQAVKELKDITG